MGGGSSKGHVQPSTDEEAKKNKENAERLKKMKLDKLATVKVLLLGAGECGKSTILKQMKIINLKEEPTEAEVSAARKLVYKNTLDAMQALMGACRDLKIPYEKPESDEIAKRLLLVDSSEEISLSLADDIAYMWEDPGIKAAKKREAEFHLLDSASYFLDRVKEYFVESYKPSMQDQLRSRVTTTGIIETSFEIEGTQIKMFDVGGQRGERKKWIHCFDDVTAIMYIASLSEYNQVLAEDRTRNRLLESLELFDGIVNLPWFQKAAVILFLNKDDLFREKIVKIDMGEFHPDYEGGLDYEAGLEYIREEYKYRNDDEDKEIYDHVTDATNTENVEFVWKTAKKIILDRKLEATGL